MKGSVTPSNRKQPTLSRRQALKTGAALAGYLVTGGVPCVHAGEDNTIRLALIGCGSRGQGAVGNALDEAIGPVKLYAMADLTEQRVTNAHQVLQKLFGVRVDVAADRRFAG